MTFFLALSRYPIVHNNKRHTRTLVSYIRRKQTMVKLLVFAAFAAIAVTAVSGNMGQGNGPQGKAPPGGRAPPGALAPPGMGNNNGKGHGGMPSHSMGGEMSGHGAAGGMKMSPWSCSAVCTETDGALVSSGCHGAAHPTRLFSRRSRRHCKFTPATGFTTTFVFLLTRRLVPPYLRASSLRASLIDERVRACVWCS